MIWQISFKMTNGYILWLRNSTFKFMPQICWPMSMYRIIHRSRRFKITKDTHIMIWYTFEIGKCMEWFSSYIVEWKNKVHKSISSCMISRVTVLLIEDFNNSWYPMCMKCAVSLQSRKIQRKYDGMSRIDKVVWWVAQVIH